MLRGREIWNLIKIWEVSRFVSRGVRGDEYSTVTEQLLDKAVRGTEEGVGVARDFPGAQLMHTRFVMTNRIASKQNAAIFPVI